MRVKRRFKIPFEVNAEDALWLSRNNHGAICADCNHTVRIYRFKGGLKLERHNRKTGDVVQKGKRPCKGSFKPYKASIPELFVAM